MDLNNATFAVYVGKTHPECLDVTFSSLARYVGAGAKLFAVDNASGHGAYFSQRSIPIHTFSEEKPKVSVLNWIFQNCQTKYLVLMESDTALFSQFLTSFQPTHAIHANIISKSQIATDPSVEANFLDAMSLGLVILDVEQLRSKGINVFDSASEHLDGVIYHQGSWLLKKAAEQGLSADDYEPSSSDFIHYELVSDLGGDLTPLSPTDTARLAEVLSLDVNFTAWGSGVFTQVPVTVQYE